LCKRYDMGDEDGIQKFIKSHVCNDICRRLGLKPLAAGETEEAAAGTAGAGAVAQIEADEALARRLQATELDEEEKVGEAGSGEGLQW
jgi:hypothetical protein